MRGYYRAVLAGDGREACDRLTDDLERDVATSRGARAVGGSCAEVLRLGAGLNPGRAGDDLSDLPVDVDERGDAAEARLDNPLTGKRETLDLVRAAGDWKIASLVLRPRR